jgi:hypothetical protein
VSLASFSLLGACATHAGQQRPRSSVEELAASLPPAVRALLAREAAPLAARPFRTPLGIEGTVPAREPPGVTPGEEFVTMVADIGATQPLTCFVYPNRIDPASSYQKLLDSAVAASGIVVLAAEVADIAVVKGSPLLVFHLAYTTQQNGQPGMGLLKVAILPHDLHSLTCVHDELGYAATFRRATAAIAGALRRPGQVNPRDRARYAELHLARILGRPAGFQEQYVTAGADGGRTMVSASTHVFNRSPKDLLGSDSHHVTAADADGTLRWSTSVDVEAGEISAQLQIEREGATLAYAYSGTRSGKKLAGRFESARPVATELLIARLLSRAGKNVPEPEARVLEWVPSIDPRRATEVVYRSDENRPGAVQAELGSILVKGTVDLNGWLERSELDLGPFTLVLERVWTKGTP